MKKITTLSCALCLALASFAQVPFALTRKMQKMTTPNVIVTDVPSSFTAKAFSAPRSVAAATTAATPEQTITIDITENVVYGNYAASMGFVMAQGESTDYVVAVGFVSKTGFVAGNYDADNTEVILSDAEENEIEIASATGTIAVEADGRISITAEAFNADSTILYKISLGAKAVEAKATKSLTFTSALFNNLLSDGLFQIYDLSNDSKTFISLALYSNQVAGTYNISDFYTSYTYWGEYDATEETVNTPVTPLYGTATITMDAAGLINVNADFIGSDSIQYLITLTSQYTEEDNSIEYDAEEDVTKIYGSDAEVVYAEANTEYGMIGLAIEDSGSEIYLIFMADKDPDIFVPAGTYTIASTYAAGTVIASTGLDDDGYLLPSYYTTFSGDNIDNAWFFVDGTVTITNVDGEMSMIIDALNSNNAKVHIENTGVVTALRDAKANATATKLLDKNGTILIQTAGNTYTVSGTIVE